MKLKDISLDDGELANEQDLIEGRDVMMTFKGRPYPAKFVQFKGN